MSLLSGCFAPKYRIDYEGKKSAFEDAKDEYRAGKNVKLVYGYAATDTDYHFCLDGEDIKTEFDSKGRIILRFTMPEHNATLRAFAINSMTYNPSDEGFEYSVKKSYHSFDGGGPDYNVEIEDPKIAKCYESKEYGKKNHAVIDGAAFNVYMRFVGMSPGATTVKISARSPVGGNYDEIYSVMVNDDLKIKMELKEKTEIDD